MKTIALLSLATLGMASNKTSVILGCLLLILLLTLKTKTK